MRSEKLICFAIGILMLIAALPAAFGSAESIALGQYDVSFDLNTPMTHTIEVQPPMVGENDTLYSASIKFTDQMKILMGISVSKNAVDSTLASELRYIKILASSDENTTVISRSVDNHMGIQTSSLSKSGDPAFTFRSWLDSVKCECGDVYAGTTKLEVLGVVPTNISDNLLNSLQVSSEQGKAISKETQAKPASVSSSAKEFNIKDPWLDSSFYPNDPAWISLHEWANAEV